jgi:transcriptional regulator GlxA family with amidase domain
VVFEGALATDIAGPSDAFGIANRHDKTRGLLYELRYVSMAGGPVRTSSGLVLATTRAAAEPLDRIDTLLVSGGSFIQETILDKPLLRWIAKAGARARRTGSVCSGAFLLAEAGLLEGRHAVTHWSMTDLFRARYPGIHLALDPIFVEDGPVWSSAGVTAGIDLALALIGRDHGPALSMAVAKQMVMFLQRPGGQAQFSAALLAQAGARRSGDPVQAITGYIAENLARDLSVEVLAAQAGMAPRSFARLFAARPDGLTPAKLVESMRVEAAAGALADSSQPVKRIAADCGFGDEERMRRAFLRRLGVAPNDYRARFTVSPKISPRARASAAKVRSAG